MRNWASASRAIEKVIVASALLSACSAPAEQEQQGLYVYGHEVETLRLCGDTATWWVLAEPHIRTALRERHAALTNRPYAPVFVNIRGRASDKPTEGFAMDYHGYFEVDTVLAVRAPNPDDCRMAEFR